MAHYILNSPAEFQTKIVPNLPLNVGDIIDFQFCGEVYTVPVNLGIGKIRIDCFGGDSDKGDSPNPNDTDDIYSRITGTIAGEKRQRGRGGYATGILNLQTLDPRVENLYVVVGEGGKPTPQGGDWAYCTFGGGGSSDAGNHYSTTPIGQTLNIIDHKYWWACYGAAGASDVRLYYDINATDYDTMSGEPSNLRQFRYQHIGSTDKGTLALKSLKSRIIVAGGAGGAKTPVQVKLDRGTETYGAGGSGGLACYEGHRLNMGYNGFRADETKPSVTIMQVPGGRQSPDNFVSAYLHGLKYRNGVFGIGGTNIEDDGQSAGVHLLYYGSGGAGGGGWFGGHATYWGGSGGSSYVAGGWHDAANPLMSFDEQYGTTLDDSYAADFGAPEGIHDTAKRTNGIRDGIVRFTVLSRMENTAKLMAQKGSTTWAAKIYTQEQKDNYTATDSRPSQFIKVASTPDINNSSQSVDFFARVTNDISPISLNFNRTMDILAVDRNSLTNGSYEASTNFTSALAYIQILGDITAGEIPAEISSLQVTGSISVKYTGGGFIEAQNDNRDLDHQQYRVSYLLTTTDQDISTILQSIQSWNTDATNSFYWNAGTKTLRIHVDDSGKNHPIRKHERNGISPAYLTGLPSYVTQMYDGLMGTGIQWTTTLSSLDQPITPKMFSAEQMITITINASIPREKAHNRHIIFIRTIGCRQRHGGQAYVNPAIQAGQFLAITGSGTSSISTPFVYTHDNVDYHILPE